MMPFPRSSSLPPRRPGRSRLGRPKNIVRGCVSRELGLSRENADSPKAWPSHAWDDLGRSGRRRTGNDHAMHQPPLALGIVGVGLVHGAAVVPDHDVALAPDMAVLEARLD